MNEPVPLVVHNIEPPEVVVEALAVNESPEQMFSLAAPASAVGAGAMFKVILSEAVEASQPLVEVIVSVTDPATISAALGL